MENRQKIVELLSRQMSRAAAETIVNKCDGRIKIVETVYFDTSGEDGKDIENVVQRVLPMFKEKKVRGNFQYLRGAGCWLLPAMAQPKETEVEKLQREIAELKAKLQNKEPKPAPPANSDEARAIELEILQRTPKPTYPQKQPALPASNNRSIRRPAPAPAESVREDDAPPF